MPTWTNPSATELLLFATVRIELRDLQARTTGFGTGFLIRHPGPGGIAETYLVTNRHVVEGEQLIIGWFTRKTSEGSPDFGNVSPIDITAPTRWHVHPDAEVDLAALPITQIVSTLAEQLYYRSPSSSQLADKELFDSLDSVTSVLFLGYPNGLCDGRNYTPLFRQGITASHPALSFSGRSEFLIDASIFPGSSGSPVFSYSLSSARSIIDYRILGALQTVYVEGSPGRATLDRIPTMAEPPEHARRLLQLGGVVKATDIGFLLEHFPFAPALLVAT